MRPRDATKTVMRGHGIAARRLVFAFCRGERLPVDAPNPPLHRKFGKRSHKLEQYANARRAISQCGELSQRKRRCSAYTFGCRDIVMDSARHEVAAERLREWRIDTAALRPLRHTVVESDI